MLQPGQRLDHYQLDSLIAESRTSAVFKATDVSTGRPVAIKAPHLESESDLVFYQRFQREAAIGQQLDHPAIAKVAPHAKQSSVYLAMTWFEGVSLRRILERETKLTAERAVQYTTAICHVLDYVHAQGVVHRDLKPENVIVSPDGSIRILDFGLASKLGSRRLTFGKLSRIMGTPDYISPEQVKGQRGDERSDIYALGVMLFEMLTGAPPFNADNPFVAMNARVENDAPLADLPPHFQTVLSRALARNPKNRYPSAAAFSNALNGNLSQQLEPAPLENRFGVALRKFLRLAPHF